MFAGFSSIAWIWMVCCWFILTIILLLLFLFDSSTTYNSKVMLSSHQVHTLLSLFTVFWFLFTFGFFFFGYIVFFFKLACPFIHQDIWFLTAKKMFSSFFGTWFRTFMHQEEGDEKKNYTVKTSMYDNLRTRTE